MIHYPAYKVAAAHVAPVFLDTDRSVDKASSVIEEAADHGARLIAFPEVFLPGFPVWAALEAPIRTHELFKRMAASAIRLDGPELARIRQTARRKGIFVSIGFTEGTSISVGRLWNANALIGADGSLLNHHRKLVPTWYEFLDPPDRDEHPWRSDLPAWFASLLPDLDRRLHVLTAAFLLAALLVNVLSVLIHFWDCQ
jgi:aliphatic nitrilase